MGKKKINTVVVLTSYPKRIRSVHRVIEGLFNQVNNADEIILYLSTLEFPQKERNLPKELLNLIGQNGFRIVWVEENLKSHKKYYYALQDMHDSIVITVDDDVIYSETMVSDLMESYKNFPYAISARRTRIVLRENGQIAKYSDWDGSMDEYAGIPRKDLCAIGVGGVLYPPHCASKDWFIKENLMSLAECQDDLWLKYNEIKEEIPVVYVRNSKKDKLIEECKETALYTHNLNGSGNDVCINKLCEYVKNQPIREYEEWFAELMQKEDYIEQKKRYYKEKIHKTFKHIKVKNIYLYGAGVRAKKIIAILFDFGLKEKIEAIIVSDKQNNPSVLEGIEVKQIDEIDQSSEFGVIFGVSDAYRNEVTELLKQYNCRIIDINFQGILRYYTI